MTDKTMTLEEARARLDRLLRLPTSAAMRSNWIDADEKAALLVLLASEASAVAKVSALQAERDEARRERDAADQAAHLGNMNAARAVTRAERAEAEVSRMREALEAPTEEIIAAIQMAVPGDKAQATVSTKVPPIAYRESKLSDAEAVAVFDAIRAASGIKGTKPRPKPGSVR
jgi:hypothetical protein